MRPRSRPPKTHRYVLGAIACVTLLPLLLGQIGFDFRVPAHAAGWAAPGVLVGFDVVTLALLLFLAIAAHLHLRIVARPGILLLGTGLILAGFADAVHVTTDGTAESVRAALSGRAATAVVLLATVLIIHAVHRERRRFGMMAVCGVGVPVVIGAWVAPLLGTTTYAAVHLTDLGVATIALQIATALLLLRLIRQGRLHFFGRGLLGGLVPLIVGQLALIVHSAGGFADGPAIAVLLQWFAWSLPATGLGIDVLLADQERNLNTEKRFLRAVVDAIPHFVFARDTDGRYTLANAAVARFFGREVAEIEGQLLGDVHGRGEEADAWLEEDRETLRRGDQWSFPEEIVRADTSRKVSVHSIKRPLTGGDDGPDQVLCVSIDVTDRLRAERALAERLELERASSAVLTSFVQCGSEDEASTVDDVLNRVCAFTGADRCYIYRLETDTGPAELLFGRVATPAADRPRPPEYIAADDLQWAASWLTVTAPIDVGGAIEWPLGTAGYRRLLDLTGPDPMIMLPIGQRGRLFGFLGIDRKGPEPWHHDTMIMLRSVGDLFITVWEKLAAERSLVEAMEAAQASSRAKTEFLANMSHEIRTPMNCIIGIADLLREMDPSEQQSQYLEMVRQAGGSLLTILNDILDISKIEAGQLELDPVRTDLRAVIEEVASLIAFTAQSRGLEVVCRLAPGLPTYGVLDGGRLRQVLTNLLNNAAKFTRRGHVYLDVEPVGGSNAAARVRFRITDTGIGIPPAQMQKIFEKFTQADAGTTRRFGGTGLGLAISRQLVDLMGGELWAESEPGRGSTFSFTVSVVRPEDPPLPVAGTARDNVLVVAGHELAGEVLTEQIRQLGCSANLVTSTPDALTMLAGAPARGDGAWRALLVDQSVPVADLQDLVAHRRSLAQARRPRLLVMTDLAAPPRDVSDDVDGFLTKPVRLDRLAAALGAPPRKAPEPAPAPPPTVPDGAPRTRVLLAEDNPFNQQVAVALLERLGCDVTVANNGCEAVDLAVGGGFDLVFMDCQMPEMDGYEATRRIRALDGSAGAVTVVAMTANALSGDREECFAAGMDDFLAKPITRDMLEAVLKRVGIRMPV